MTNRVTVKKSKIHGNGVFATREFKKGEIVFILKGTIHKHINKTIKDTFLNPDWVGVEKNTWIDPYKKFHFINHSCDPNMGIKGKVTFCALKHIKKGDELIFDYSLTEEDPNWKMNCSCKSKNCRKVVRSIMYLPIKTYLHYLPFVSTYFKKVYNNKHKLN